MSTMELLEIVFENLPVQNAPALRDALMEKGECTRCTRSGGEMAQAMKTGQAQCGFFFPHLALGAGLDDCYALFFFLTPGKCEEVSLTFHAPAFANADTTAQQAWLAQLRAALAEMLARFAPQRIVFGWEPAHDADRQIFTLAPSS